MDPYWKLGWNSVEVPLAVVSFCATPAIAEMGSSVSNVVLRWAFDRDIDSAVVTNQNTSVDQTVPGNQQFLNVAGPFTANQSWSVEGTIEGVANDQSTGLPKDINDKVANGRTSLSFQNKAYWGSVAAPPAVSADIFALPNSAFATTNTKHLLFYSMPNFYPCLSYPARLGVPTKVLTSSLKPGTRDITQFLPFTDYTVTTIRFTNPSGYVEPYIVATFNSPQVLSNFQVNWG